MQRAAAHNSFFGVAFLRRMVALYLIMIGVVILSGRGYNVLPYYAMVGVLLLLFWKVPVKILPFLALFFFLLPWAGRTIDKINARLETETLNKNSSNTDTAFLDKFVGVYEQNPENWVILMRKERSLYGYFRYFELRLLPISDTSFAHENRTVKQYFVRDSTGKIVKFVLHNNGQVIFTAKRINKSIPEGLKKLEEQRADITESLRERPNYSEFVNKNPTNTWENIQNLSLQNFFSWRNDYTIGYILVLFLLGLYAGKRKIFYDVPKNYELLIKVFMWGMIVGGAGIAISLGFEARNFIQGIQWQNYSQHYSSWTITFINLPWQIGSIIMALGYIAGLTLLLENTVWKNRLSFFAPVGRMGFTNYIFQLFAYMMIFDKVSWFWGLEGKTGCFYRLLLAISVYVILYSLVSGGSNILGTAHLNGSGGRLLI